MVAYVTKVVRIAPLMALILAGPCGIVPAQVVAAPANAFHLTVVVSGYAEPPRRDERDSLINWVRPASDITSWLLPGDPELKVADAIRPPPSAREWLIVTLDLTAGANGLATGCAPSADPVANGDSAPTQDLVALAESLCRRIAPRALFHPALSDDGKRRAGIFRLRLGFHHDDQKGASPTIEPAHFMSVAMVSLPPSVDKPGWPPAPGWLSAYFSRPVFPTDMPITTFANRADHSPWAGVILAGLDTGQPFCTIISPSGSAAIDDKACDFARRKIRPSWSDQLPPRDPALTWDDSSFRHSYSTRDHVPVIITLDRGKLAAVPPREAGATLPQLSPAAGAGLAGRVMARWPDGSRHALRAARLQLLITPAGKVTHCLIVESTGSDDGDIAYCRTLLDDIIFEPARDLFGWPRTENSMMYFSLPAG